MTFPGPTMQAAPDGPPAATRHFDFRAMPAPDRYRLLASTIMPRPIALVVTVSAQGVINAAPFSFFNLFGSDRPVVALGILSRDGQPKDTSSNILATREFVVNLVPYSLAPAMNITCVDAPPSVDEIQLAGLTTAPSLGVTPPRLAQSPVAFECRLLHSLETGPAQWLMVGEVLHAHIAATVLSGPADRPRIDAAALDLIGRMHGPSAYTRTHDLFDMPRPVWTNDQAQDLAPGERKD